MSRTFARAVGPIFLTIPALVHCGNLGGIDAAACPALSPNRDALSAHFSARADVDGKVRTFVQASKDLVGVSMQMEAEAAQACRRIGADLGMSPAEMSSRGGAGGDAAGACNAVGAKIDSILRAGVQIQVQATPPACQASAQAEASCQGACNVQMTPAEIIAKCEPGKLAGSCQGTCSGQCEGQCNGQCNGQCSARDAQGRCVGQCSGACTGSCGGTCHASCQGTWQAPHCEGRITGPQVDAECNASCHAHASFQASCSPAVVNVNVSQNTEMAMRLAATLRANLPLLLHAEIALGKRVLGDAKAVVDVGAALPRIVGQAGAEALACIAASADAAASASVRINVSVQASASVSGRVGAGLSSDHDARRIATRRAIATAAASARSP